MTTERLLELISIERLCVIQNILDKCDHDCTNCPLAQKDTEILTMFDEVSDIVAFYGDLCKKRLAKQEAERDNLYG